MRGPFLCPSPFVKFVRICEEHIIPHLSMKSISDMEEQDKLRQYIKELERRVYHCQLYHKDGIVSSGNGQPSSGPDVARLTSPPCLSDSNSRPYLRRLPVNRQTSRTNIGGSSSLRNSRRSNVEGPYPHPNAPSRPNLAGSPSRPNPPRPTTTPLIHVGTAVCLISTAQPLESDVSNPRRDTILSEFDQVARPPKRPRKACTRWENIAKEILLTVPDACGWLQRRRSLGLDSEKNEQIIAALAGVDNVGCLLELDITTRSAHDSLDPIGSAKAYAQLTKASNISTKLSIQLQNFRTLVLVTLCTVLERCNYEVGAVDEIMQICISNSTATHLKRLRAGAIWVNRLISKLWRSGWGYQASELFFLCECADSSPS